MNKRHSVLLILILIAAALVRFTVVAKHAGAPLTGDEPGYDSIAWNLVTGHGYSIGYTDPQLSAARGPSYILMLAAFYSVLGHNITAPLIFQSLMDVFCCVIVFWICRILFRRVDVALFSTALYAIYPPFILNVKYILTEGFVNFMSLAAVAGILAYYINRWKAGIYISAAAVGLGALAKPILVLFPLLVFFAFMIGSNRKQLVKEFVIQLAVVAVIMSPWIVRNSLTFHSFIPGVTQGGFTFWGGAGPANGYVIGGLDNPRTPSYVFAAIEGKTELERDKWFYQDGVRIIRENPGRYAVLMLKKIPRLWFNLMHDDPPSKASIVLAAYNLMMMLFTVVGIRAFKPSSGTTRILLLLTIYFTGIHMLFFSVVRYSQPVYAYMFCFSAAGMIAVLERLIPSRATGKDREYALVTEDSACGVKAD